MRKDSQIFLKKLLEYREKISADSFELNYRYFMEIPNIEANLHEIINDLICNDCLSSNSQIMNLEGDIKIILTLDGIMFFDEMEKKNREIQSTVWNVYGGQVNIANDSGNITSVLYENEIVEKEDRNDIIFDKLMENKFEELFGAEKKEQQINTPQLIKEDLFKNRIGKALINQWIESNEVEKKKDEDLVLERFWKRKKELNDNVEYDSATILSEEGIENGKN